MTPDSDTIRISAGAGAENRSATQTPIDAPASPLNLTFTCSKCSQARSFEAVEYDEASGLFSCAGDQVCASRRRWSRRPLAVLAWLASAGAAAVAVLVALCALLVTFGPRVLPFQVDTILTGSMEPTLSPGAVILLRPVEAGELKVGDIIAFKQPDHNDRVVAHRIVRIEQTASGPFLVTKGDANSVEDSWRIPATGEGWRYSGSIPGLGTILGTLQSPLVRLSLIAVPALLLGVLWLRDIWRPSTAPRHA